MNIIKNLIGKNIVAFFTSTFSGQEGSGQTPEPELTTHASTTGVRLVGGDNDLEGRVEVLYNGNWGTVCDDRWDLEDAKVVCRMLGYEVSGTASFGPGDGLIILDEMSCLGEEADLSECGHNGHLNHDCSHSEDAGVVCSVKGTLIFIPFRFTL